MLGRRPIVLSPSDRAFIHQPVQAVEVETGKIALGFNRGQLRLLLTGVELYQYVSLTNRLARIERDATDDAWEVRAHGDALDRSHCADGAQRCRPFLLPREDGRDGFRRWLESGGLLSGLLKLPELHEAEHYKDHHGHS